MAAAARIDVAEYSRPLQSGLAQTRVLWTVVIKRKASGHIMVGNSYGAMGGCRTIGLVAALLVGAWLGTSGFQAEALGAEVYPQRAIRLIVPYPPGGAGDIVGRMLDTKLGDAMGQQIVVDNRPGGGQLIATQLAAKAAPDGYTLFLASATHRQQSAGTHEIPANGDRSLDETHTASQHSR